MIRALFTIGVLQFLSMLLLLTRTKVLAVTVGPDGVGVISAIDRLTMLIAQSLSLSLPFATLRFLPAAMRESPESAWTLFRQMRFVLVALLVPAAVACILVSLAWPATWGNSLLPFRRSVILALAGLPVLGLVPFLTNASAALVGHVRSMWVAIGHAAVLVVAAVVAASGFGVDGFYAAYAVAGLVFVLAVTRSMTGPDAGPQRRWSVSAREAFRLPAAVWRFAAWLMALAFATPYAAWYVQYSTLRFYGADASGILQAAIGISLSLRALLGAAHAVFLTPQVNLQASAVERIARANEFQRGLSLLFLVSVPPLLLFPDIALRVLYASPFVAATPFVLLFVASEVIAMLAGTYQSLIIAGDRMAFHVMQNLGAQALLAGTAAVLLPRIGLTGAGVGALAASLFLALSTVVFLKGALGVRMSREAAHMALLTGAVLLGGGLIGQRFTGAAPALLIAKGTACLAIWLLAYGMMPAEDRERARLGLARVRAAGIVRWARGGDAR